MRLILCCLMAGFAFAQQPTRAKELDQYNFVIGNWDISMEYKNPKGEWNAYKAQWDCEWLADKTMIHQHWKGKYTQGSEFKTWNVKKKHWEGYNYYRANKWNKTKAEWKGNKMVVIIYAQNAKGPFLNRETYKDIKANSFYMSNEHSYDDGKTWKEGNYRIKAKRIK